MWTVLVTLAMAQEPWPRDRCDIPAADLARPAARDVDACEQACRDHPECGGYTFVSGWNQCKLEHPGGKAVRVQMHAATVVTDEGQRTTTEPVADADHSGRDLEPTPRDVPDVGACATACLGEPACVGFVYVQGYRACWLKGTEGALVPKRFTCAQRP